MKLWHFTYNRDLWWPFKILLFNTDVDHHTIEIRGIQIGPFTIYYTKDLQAA